MALSFKLNRSFTGDNLIQVTSQLLSLLKTNVSFTTLKETLLSHPDYPSLLSISESLDRWKVNSVGLQASPDKLEELPTPFIAYIKGQRFITITKVMEDTITYLDKDNREQTVSKDEYLNRWEVVVLLAESGKQSGEADYKRIRRTETWHTLRIPLAFFGLFCLGWVQVGSLIVQQAPDLLYYTSVMILQFAGMILTGLLIWYEYDQQNTLLQKVCSMGKKTNCPSVLSSKAAKVIGNISWSDIGFIYFTGGYLYLLITGTSFLPVITLLNLIALPYIVFSIYYQARVARQWCTFCLSVQAVLLLEFVAALLTHQPFWQPMTSSVEPITIGILSFLLPAAGWLFTKDTIYQAKKGTDYRYQLARFKNNGEVFAAMLRHQPAVARDPGDMGITIGNPNAKNTLIKVCNPYCGPCAQAHPKIEKLIDENENWQVQIIFTASGDDEDRRTAPAAHMLAVAANNNEAQTRKALDDWYNAEEKNYKQFAAKYPMNGELKLQKGKLKMMDNWCKDVGITHTPTFFINGYQLPNTYDITDLKYITSP